ncbi:polysaccharide deacetylase family protein [Kineococcus gynurae]|uniref:Polysaccharide deacetylase family protein n=1 Tax=Kineococcus gynurae TaxID=452979 RepID=A0ABV5LXC0_9ACTN
MAGTARTAGPTTSGPDLLVRRRVFSDFANGGRAVGSDALPAPLERLLRPVTTIVRAEAGEAVAALTYDDGPDPEQTPPLLDLLAADGLRCTFFVLVDQAEKHPGLVARMLAEGHEVALHGIDHSRLTEVSTATAVARVREGRERLQQLTGTPVRFFRPPYGAQTLAQARGFRRLGLEIVLWSGWASDWVHDEVPALAARVVAPLRPGAVVLLHDRRGDPETSPAEELPRFSRAAVLREALALLAGRGESWRFTTMGSLLAEAPAVRSVWGDLPDPRAVLGGRR